MLATMLVALVTSRGVAEFGVGDGVVALGDDVRVVRAARSGPAYPAYRVKALGEAPTAQLFFVAGAGDGRAVTLATDGGEPMFASGRSPLRALRVESIGRESALRGELEAEVARAAEAAADDVAVALLVARGKERR